MRPSEDKNVKYTITLWFDNKTTHIRIKELGDSRYQLEFDSISNFEAPVR